MSILHNRLFFTRQFAIEVQDKPTAIEDEAAILSADDVQLSAFVTELKKTIVSNASLQALLGRKSPWE